MTQCSHLSKIQLYFIDSTFGDQAIIDLSISLESLSNISFLLLDLQKSSINNQEASELGSILASCKNLEYLTLNLKDNYHIGAQGTKGLFSELLTFQNIQTFILYFLLTKIGNEGLVSVSNFLSQCPLLSRLHLYLGQTGIGLSGIQSLLYSFSICTSLSNLQLGIYQLDEESSSILVKGLENCQSLHTIILTLGINCPFEGDLDGEIVDFNDLAKIILKAKFFVKYNIQANQYFH
ncbi:hypothetical protein ABPG72_020235 [Tetrahymena utriculariae]